MLHFIHEGMGFDHWVFGPSFPSFLSPYHPSLRYVLSLKTTLRPWHHTLCLIALMWAILGIDSRAFWLCWTRGYGMTLHWGIAISESFIIGWPWCWGILFSVDDGFLSHVHSPEDIRCHFSSHWSMRHDWRVSSSVLYTGAYPFRSMMVLRHSCSLEMIGFISHWSTGHDWLISLTWSQEHSLLIIVDIFLRWLDQDTDTYESIQQSLVISGFVLYWGITLSLAFGLRDIGSHWDMFSL